MKTLPSLSIVLPCHDEEDVIESTYKELKGLIDEWLTIKISAYQLVMVNNGSTDNTLQKMLQLKQKDNNIKILDLRNDYGYQGSITAGLYYSDHDMIVSIDADLQDDPSKISEMIDFYSMGYEMVLGIRKSRKFDSFFKRVSAIAYYRFLKIIGVKSVYNHGEFRLLSKSLVEEMKLYPERNRYIRSIILSLESKYACVYYDREPRRAGKTKFRFFKLISLALDGITSFSNFPIRIILLLGLFMFLLSIVILIYVIYIKCFTELHISGWASISIMILFFGGIQNLFLGILGEYIAKTYIETKQRPFFSVRKLYE